MYFKFSLICFNIQDPGSCSNFICYIEKPISNILLYIKSNNFHLAKLKYWSCTYCSWLVLCHCLPVVGKDSGRNHSHFSHCGETTRTVLQRRSNHRCQWKVKKQDLTEAQLSSADLSWWLWTTPHRSNKTDLGECCHQKNGSGFGCHTQFLQSSLAFSAELITQSWFYLAPHSVLCLFFLFLFLPFSVLVLCNCFQQ